MTRCFTPSEALEFLETTFNTGPDSICTGMVDATIAGVDVAQASADLESYLSIIAALIDPDSITIMRDVIDGSDMDAVRIIIKTGREDQ